jgi:hypothetical protein
LLPWHRSRVKQTAGSTAAPSQTQQSLTAVSDSDDQIRAGYGQHLGARSWIPDKLIFVTQVIPCCALRDRHCRSFSRHPALSRASRELLHAQHHGWRADGQMNSSTCCCGTSTSAAVCVSDVRRPSVTLITRRPRVCVGRAAAAGRSAKGDMDSKASPGQRQDGIKVQDSKSHEFTCALDSHSPVAAWSRIG